MWNETGTFRPKFSRKIWNGPRFKMRWKLFPFVLFFELVWNVSVVPGDNNGLIIWSTWRTLDNIKMLFGECNLVCPIWDMSRPLPSPTCK
jgi:hypothetical protein